MKKLSLLDKFLFIVNSILASVLLVSILSAYISPNTLSYISLLSLFTPILILLNFICILYWLLKLKKQFLLSTITLLIGFQQVNSLYSLQEKKILLTDDVKIMSYNVRMFNLYNWIEKDSVNQNIYNFIHSKNPDILCIQEFHPSNKIGEKYPYSYIKIKGKQNQFGHAIFSKYKIVNSGSLNFTNTSNNTIFADIVKNNDTIRIYNVHLESLKINPKKENFNTANSEKTRIRLESAFKKQANQVVLLLQHQKKTQHKTIICGDFNNTAFSWVYTKLKKGKKDAFEVAGKGFGKTFDFNFFPFRIDFILIDEKIEIHNFKTYSVKYSDHRPIMARVKI